MLRVLTDLPEGITGVKAVGRVSREDYEQTLEPLLDRARTEGRRMRFLYELGSEFEGFTPGAAWEDLRLGMRSMQLFDGCAVLGDHPVMRGALRVATFLMPCPIRVFPETAREEALSWLRGLPGSGLRHQFVDNSGVLLVDVSDTLRKHDFEELSSAADAWIEVHGKLTGLVVHAREFPGWQNVDAMLSHLRFVREHHRKVDRVAVASDARIASIAPALAERFSTADVKSFDYDSLDSAISWAKGEVSPAQYSARDRSVPQA